eukprot:Polyplicarium_translucidae@DN2826_c0_g1_i5.p2
MSAARAISPLGRVDDRLGEAVRGDSGIRRQETLRSVRGGTWVSDSTIEIEVAASAQRPRDLFLVRGGGDWYSENATLVRVRFSSPCEGLCRREGFRSIETDSAT